jgi:hypothetical protein
MSLQDSTEIFEVEDGVADVEAASGRRRFITTLLAAGAAGVSSVVLSESPAGAVDGGSYSGTETSFTNTTTDATAAGVKGTFTNANGVGVRGIADVGNLAAGVEGKSVAGYGVYGSSSTGYGLYSGGNGRIGLDSVVASGQPTSGSYAVGDIVRNAAGDTFSCVAAGVAGAPGGAQFRKMAGPDSVGSYHMLTSPTVCYDSRFFNGAAGAGPKHGLNETRTVDLRLNNKFPVEANAITVNIILFETENSGFFTVIPGDAVFNGIGQLYWSGANQIVTGAYPVRVQRTGGEARAKIVTGAPTHITITVTGYYL